jgi:hypothetical protein
MANKAVIYKDEIHLDTDGEFAVGDRFEVFRGDGPREGDFMGYATVTRIDDEGPELKFDLGA